MLIRPLVPADIAPVAELLHALAQQFIIHEIAPGPASTFLRENDAAAIGRHLQNGFVYHVAEDNGVIAGFIGMRERQHLYHLFVGTGYQHQGLARRLWDTGRAAALAAGATPPFTVNASNHAVAAYERLGFVRTAPVLEKHGVRFNPMQWSGEPS